MPAMIVKIENTGDIDWFVVVDSGLTTVPILGRDNASGMVRHITDKRIRKAFLDAKEAAELAAQTEAGMTLFLAELKEFFDEEEWSRVQGIIDNLTSEAVEADNVTSDFHPDPDPQIYLLDESVEGYLLLPSPDQDVGTPIVAFGDDAVFEGITKLRGRAVYGM